MVKKKSKSKEMGLKEVRIGNERVGFSENFGKVAVLSPKVLVERGHQQMYDRTVHQLKNQGYKVIYTSTEKPKELSRKRVYDILQGL